MVEMEKRTYRLTGFTPILGSSPANSEVRTRYILEKESKMNLKNLNEEQKKAKTQAERERIQKKAEEEASFLREGEDDKITVFMSNPKTGSIMLLDYQVKGFIKGSLESLTAQTGIKAPRGKADKYVFVSPRYIEICDRFGNPVKSISEHNTREASSNTINSDEIFERPLRAMTMKGERVSLAASEQILDPWQITFTVSLLPNERSKVSASIKWEDIERALDYGEMRGLGQFRNGGYGRFTWERVDDQEEEKVTRHGA